MKFTENTTRINCMHYFFHKSCWCFVPLGWPSRVFSKGARYSWEAKPILQWQESDFCFSTIDGRTFHLHLHNFDMSVKGREIFSRDNLHGKLLSLGGSLAVSGIKPWSSSPKPNAITTRLFTATLMLFLI